MNVQGYVDDVVRFPQRNVTINDLVEDGLPRTFTSNTTLHLTENKIEETMLVATNGNVYLNGSSLGSFSNPPVGVAFNGVEYLVASRDAIYVPRMAEALDVQVSLVTDIRYLRDTMIILQEAAGESATILYSTDLATWSSSTLTIDGATQIVPLNISHCITGGRDVFAISGYYVSNSGQAAFVAISNDLTSWSVSNIELNLAGTTDSRLFNLASSPSLTVGLMDYYNNRLDQYTASFSRDLRTDFLTASTSIVDSSITTILSASTINCNFIAYPTTPLPNSSTYTLSDVNLVDNNLINYSASLSLAGTANIMIAGPLTQTRTYQATTSTAPNRLTFVESPGTFPLLPGAPNWPVSLQWNLASPPSSQVVNVQVTTTVTMSAPYQVSVSFTFEGENYGSISQLGFLFTTPIIYDGDISVTDTSTSFIPQSGVTYVINGIPDIDEGVYTATVESFVANQFNGIMSFEGSIDISQFVGVSPVSITVFNNNALYDLILQDQQSTITVRTTSSIVAPDGNYQATLTNYSLIDSVASGDLTIGNVIETFRTLILPLNIETGEVEYVLEVANNLNTLPFQEDRYSKSQAYWNGRDWFFNTIDGVYRVVYSTLTNRIEATLISNAATIYSDGRSLNTIVNGMLITNLANNVTSNFTTSDLIAMARCNIEGEVLYRPRTRSSTINNIARSGRIATSSNLMAIADGRRLSIQSPLGHFTRTLMYDIVDMWIDEPYVIVQTSKSLVTLYDGRIISINKNASAVRSTRGSYVVTRSSCAEADLDELTSCGFSNTVITLPQYWSGTVSWKVGYVLPPPPPCPDCPPCPPCPPSPCEDCKAEPTCGVAYQPCSI